MVNSYISTKFGVNSLGGILRKHLLLTDDDGRTDDWGHSSSSADTVKQCSAQQAVLSTEVCSQCCIGTFP